jgi:hypothetical protein
VRFVDLLKTTVLLSAGAATTLAVVCVAGASRNADEQLVFIVAAWWVVAGVIGALVGRRAETTPPIARALAQSKAAKMMPDHRPGAVVLNRLWPLILCTILAGALAFLAPQVPGIAAGFTIIWALAWRQQDRAVTAIEERDGVTFYVERTSPVQRVQLIRVPGLRREVPTLDGAPPPA